MAAHEEDVEPDSSVSGASRIIEQLGLRFSLTNGDDRYKLYDEIGSGGVAKVFFGMDEALHRPVAVKILRKRYLKDKGSVALFLNEAKITAMLDHPGIVPVFDVGLMSNGELFFAMERVQGHTLRTILDNPKKHDYNRSDLLSIFEQVCQIIAYAHSRGIVHRDIKPANIMVGKYNTVYVMDWGIARNLNMKIDERRSTTLNITQLLKAKQVKGTPRYMSPEQILGMADIRSPSDVFSLGLLMYEILEGKHPFACDTARDTMHAIKNNPLPKLSSMFISNNLKSISQKACAKLPQNRYPSAAEFAEDMKRSLSLEQVSVYKDNPAIRFTKLLRRNKLATFVTVVFLSITGILSYHKLTNNNEFNELLALADNRRFSAINCQKQIEYWKAAKLPDDQEAYRKTEIARLMQRKNIKLASARALLFVALKKNGKKLPQPIVKSLKDTWFEELQLYLQLNDYSGARDAFNEMKEFLGAENEIMHWNKKELHRIQRFRSFLFKSNMTKL
ncbi:MAG: serine/threonine protein kinase [Lentisphaeria bacterium]|nr:serine/threonine protein kinase [Lentisphaeria bacterium]NQZ70685.1 serine/threonine protein kinase [Lentisphaeria bacterium]